jgi:hypothetical protein
VTSGSKSTIVHFLEQGPKTAAGIDRFAGRTEDYPDRDRLALRFEQFEKAE